MANLLNVSIPATKSFFYDKNNKAQVKAAMGRIYSQYKSEIDYAAIITKVPKQIIISFIFIESNGDPTAVSSAGAIGLMQLMTSASDILVMERLKKRLAPEEIAMLTKYLGKRFTDGIMKMRYLGDRVTVDGVTSAVWLTKADLIKPPLNILIGAIYLGLLIDESSRNGKVDLHKVVIRYNKGYFADGKGSKLPDSVEDTLATLKTVESKNYILKFVGTNGTLDMLSA